MKENFTSLEAPQTTCFQPCEKTFSVGPACLWYQHVGIPTMSLLFSMVTALLEV